MADEDGPARFRQVRRRLAAMMQRIKRAFRKPRAEPQPAPPAEPQPAPPAGALQQRRQPRDGQRRARSHGTKSAVTAIAFATIFTMALLAVIPAALWGLKKVGITRPEVVLSVVLIAATASLVIMIAILSVVFSRLKMSNHTAAMGLPEGSIRAIIALLLVTLFFISALFLYLSVAEGSQRGPTRTLQGITAQQLAALPAADIDSVTPRIVGAATVYDVTLAGQLPDRSRADDIAAQLVTTVGTLVTAVAAFYFGANSVQTARSRQLKETRDQQLGTSGQGRTRDQTAAISDAGAEGQPETAVGQAEMTGGQAETAGEVPP